MKGHEKKNNNNTCNKKKWRNFSFTGNGDNWKTIIF